MDVEYVNPFLHAAVKVFKTMARTEAEAGKPFLKKGDLAKGDISGIIGLSNENLEASLSLSFHETCICFIVSNMLGEMIQKINMEVVDAVGEITNMISGDGRRELSEQGISLKAGIPTVVKGKGHSIKHMTRGPVIAIPFKTKAGPFVIEVGHKSLGRVVARR